MKPPLADVGRKLGYSASGSTGPTCWICSSAPYPPGVVCLGARCVGFERHDRGATALFADGRREEGKMCSSAPTA